eukprot:jgi/Mesvir1/19266/Mv10346-RA.1
MLPAGQGFRKLFSISSEQDEYWHPSFQRGQYSQLKFVQRSDSKQASRNVPASLPTAEAPAPAPAPEPAPAPAPALASFYEPHGNATAYAGASAADLEAKVHHLERAHACMTARMEEQDRVLRDTAEMLRAMQHWAWQVAALCNPAVAEACKGMGGDHTAMWHLFFPGQSVFDQLSPSSPFDMPASPRSKPPPPRPCGAGGAHACFNAHPVSSSDAQPHGGQMEAGPGVAVSVEEADVTVTVGVGGTGGLTGEAGDADADACPGTPIEELEQLLDEEFLDLVVPLDAPMPTDNDVPLPVPGSVDLAAHGTGMEVSGAQLLLTMHLVMDMHAQQVPETSTRCQLGSQGGPEVGQVGAEVGQVSTGDLSWFGDEIMSDDELRALFFGPL